MNVVCLCTPREQELEFISDCVCVGGSGTAGNPQNNLLGGEEHSESEDLEREQGCAWYRAELEGGRSQRHRKRRLR